jgi:Calcineurin-like phosphoesterase
MARGTTPAHSNPGQPSADPGKSTSHSSTRYAHPFYSATQKAGGDPAAGKKNLTEWSKSQLGPIPAMDGSGVIELETIIGSDAVKEIEQLGEIRFHALGDSGVGHADEAEQVADDMATDYQPDAGALNPAFLFHLGDVIYGPDKENHYGERFYRPYRNYPGKILAIAGNHDGEAKNKADQPSLSAFLANFCTKAAVVPQQAAGSGIYRETMTEPCVYWLLETPFLRIIGLYSNLLEELGFLEGDRGKDNSQLDWLTKTLKSIANGPKKALIIATHHPPYSKSGHAGSTEMSQSIDAACAATQVTPDAFLSAHAHNYQRYTRRINGKQVPYLVVGTGGMPTQAVHDALGQPADQQTTYDAALASLGSLYVSASAQRLRFEFWRLGNAHTDPFDPFTIDLGTHLLTRG